MGYQMTGPSFAFCGPFPGQMNISANRWFRKFDYEMSGFCIDGRIPADKYLSFLNMLLTEDAAEWADSYPDAIRLLEDPNPTQETVDSFKALLCDRFPSRIVEVVPVPFDVELSELKQKEDESLASFYKRVLSLMQRVGARDRPIAGSTALTILESSMLDMILRAFIRGINDLEVRKETIRGMIAIDRSLKNIYQLAEEAKRTNLELQNLHDEELRHAELDFYKELVQRNLPPQQIEAMLKVYTLIIAGARAYRMRGE